MYTLKSQISPIDRSFSAIFKSQPARMITIVVNKKLIAIEIGFKIYRIHRKLCDFKLLACSLNRGCVIINRFPLFSNRQMRGIESLPFRVVHGNIS